MKFIFTLSVWADWHVNQFFKNALPSLRAPGNLDSVDYRISVHTCPCDVEGLRKALAGLVYDVEATLPDNITSDRNAAHPVVSRFKEEDRAAAGDGDVWLLLAPDMVWAQGTLAYYRHLFEQGKKAIFRPLLRVDSDKAGTIADFSNRALAKVALESEHDLVKKFYRASGPHFSRHAEMVTWEAPGGLVNQTVDDDLAGDIGAGLLYRNSKIDQASGRPRSRFAVTSDDAHAIDEDHAQIAILGRPRGGDHRFPARRQHLR